MTEQCTEDHHKNATEKTHNTQACAVNRLSAAQEGVVKALSDLLDDKTPWAEKAIVARAALAELEEAQK